MNNLLAAFGLVLVIEGALYALFPDVMRRAMAMMLSMDEMHIRISAVVSAVLGLALVWLALG
ncbi:DUF2065 domain-containing protein [Magnetovibrio sp.]|uniref:DUF2065 domain-containing protein n=1 Tax=Magnetovibrio sp. TaxID=2024836 RepID=UPI002F959D65